MFKGQEVKGELNGFLDGGSHIQGELHFEDTFRIEGKVTGNIKSRGDLVVGENGEIDGEIRVGQLFVSGVVRGTIEASSRVELTAGCRVVASVKSPVLVIEDGAYFQGRCEMGGSDGRAKAEPARQPGLVAQMPGAKAHRDS